MAKFVFRIIALVVLVIGCVLSVFSKSLVPDHKGTPEERARKMTKLRLIGFVICLCSALIFLIVSLF